MKKNTRLEPLNIDSVIVEVKRNEIEALLRIRTAALAMADVISIKKPGAPVAGREDSAAMLRTWAGAIDDLVDRIEQATTDMKATVRVSAEELREIAQKSPVWELCRPEITIEHLGYLPDWINAGDPRSACEQLDAGYAPIGGGFALYAMEKGMEKRPDIDPYALKYPGDPVLLPLAKCYFRDEVVVLYRSDLVAVWQPNGSFRMARFS